MSIIGDVLHNILDGIVIAGSFLVSIEVGVVTTIAVLLHEIPQEIGDFGILLHGGFGVKKALAFNFLTALTAFIGAALALLLGKYIQNIVMFLLPFAAGNFIYIAVSDLFPELRKTYALKKAVLQLLVILLGIGLMFAILLVE